MAARLLFYGVLLAVTVLAFLPSYESLPDVVSFSDILNHFAAFATLTVLFAFAHPQITCKQRALLLLAYGTFIEAVQHFLPDRCASAEDLAVDAAGIAAGWLLLTMQRKYRFLTLL